MLKKLINDLLASGLSQTELAEEIGTEYISQSTVSRMASGVAKDCTRSLYERIEKLHEKRCKKSAASIS